MINGQGQWGPGDPVLVSKRCQAGQCGLLPSVFSLLNHHVPCSILIFILTPNMLCPQQVHYHLA